MSKILELRESKGISQQELAEKIGITNVAMHYIENGKRSASKEVAVLIAKFLDVEVDEIFLPSKYTKR